VAVKVPDLPKRCSDNKIFSVLAEVRQEIRMMKNFEGHPFIIDLYGVVFMDLNPVVIVELAEDTVTEYLAKKLDDDGHPVDWNTKARFCAEVADGLRALHAASIIHGDLKADNVLLFQDKEEGELVAKISDFGYSATAASIKFGSGTGGTANFFAPECTPSAGPDMKKHENKPTKDNYAFGLFVWQVAKDGDVPYDDMDPAAIDQSKNTDRDLSELMMQLPDDTPGHFKAVISAMTTYNPEERADLATVRQTMGADDDAKYEAARKEFEATAKDELPRDISKPEVGLTSFPPRRILPFVLSVSCSRFLLQFASVQQLMFIPKSIKSRMIRGYEAAAAKGDTEAMFFLSACYGSGFGMDIDKENMIEWAIKAAERGNLDAVRAIAANYHIFILPDNRTLLFSHLLRAAEAGHRASMLQVRTRTPRKATGGRRCIRPRRMGMWKS